MRLPDACALPLPLSLLIRLLSLVARLVLLGTSLHDYVSVFTVFTFQARLALVGVCWTIS